ncbi:FtsX-like permease family protein [Microbacterium jejuense]|uniref:FtsX-like permease family protein n=1 Tax=Microbacterium jejuense TaxID=1263637 RepID=UPI0031EEE295
MPDRSAPASAARLLRKRSAARAGLLASAAATIAVAVATVCLVLAWLAHAVAGAGDPPPPGVDAEDVADQVAAGAAALASASPALVLLVALLAGTAVAQLARLIAAAREHETATVRARGFSRAQAWTTDAAEGAVVALAGTVVGLIVAAAASALVGAGALAGLAAWPWALALAVLLTAVFAVALRRGEGRRTSARTTRTTTAAVVVVLLLATGLVVWQLPLARGAGFDPIVAIAPAVVLSAAAVVALAVFGAAAVAWARPAASSPALEPGYPARQVARRIPIFAVAVLLVALTVAQAVFTAAYGATWTAATSDSAAVRAGADLRVDTTPQAVTPTEVADASAVPGVVAAAGALATDIEVGELDAQLVAAPVTSLDTVVTTAGDLIDTAALAATVDGTVTAEPVDLGDAATGLRVTVQVAGQNGTNAIPVLLSAVLLDATGTPAVLTLTGDPAPQGQALVTYTAQGDLPDGTAPWRLLALLLGTPLTPVPPQESVTVVSAEAIGGATLELDGSASLTNQTRESVLWLADGGDGATGAEPPSVSAAVTHALAERLGIGVGDQVEFRYSGVGRRGAATIASLVDAVPGTSAALALFVPMETLLVSQLQRGTSIVPPDAVWAAGDTAAADAYSAALDDRPVETSAPGVTARVVGALVPGWWIATVGSAALSLVAALAIVQTLAIARRRELGVLRAAGVTAGRQARMRAAELGGVFGAAVVLGAAAGVLVSVLIVPSLVRAVTPGILSIAGGVDIAWVPLGLAIAALVVGLGAIVAAAAAGVRRAARTATVGEESR